LLAVFAGAAGQAITFTVVIAVASRTVPVGLMKRTGLWYIPLQLPDMAALFRFRFDIRAVLSPVLRQRIVPVFKPRTFGDVFRMVLQQATAEVALSIMLVLSVGLFSPGSYYSLRLNQRL